MITIFTFYNKIKNNKISDSVLSIVEAYNKLLNSLEVNTVACPTCGHHEMIRWGFYFRRISITGDIYRLKIQRLYCKNCNHSHAVFIADIIPYQMINIKSAINIVRGKEFWKEVLLDNPQLYDSDLYRLFKKYNQFKERLLVIRKSFEDGIESIIPSFFDEYHIQLFQCYENQIHITANIV